jgi:selenocysteine lyase/cysteine desulfurase
MLNSGGFTVDPAEDRKDRHMIDPAFLDEQYPHRPVGYFDAAAVGAVPAAVVRAVSGVAAALEGGLSGSAAWHERTDRAFEFLAEDLGVTSHRLVAAANTSDGINHAARAIPFSEGDEVLAFADDFPSARMPWTTLAATRVRHVDPGVGDERTVALLSAIDERTRVVSVTHVHASTGTTLDLSQIAEACRAVDALLIVDGAQAAGLLPLAAMHADVYVAASYKWLSAGFGAAVIATSERFDALAVPALVGYRNVPPSPRLHVGHDNLFGLAALQAAAEVRRIIGIGNVLEHTRRLIGRISEGATAAGIGLGSDHAGAGIVSLAVADAPGLVSALSVRGLIAAHRDGLLRVSPSVITTDADVDHLLEALSELAAD